MEGMRDLLRSSLGRALRELEPIDRLAAAWPVAAGALLAEHGRIASYNEGVLTIEVEQNAWLNQLLSMRQQLTAELVRIARVPITAIHFESAAARARAAARSLFEEKRPVTRRPARPRAGDRR